MGQKQFFNWQDDDSTKDLDHMRLGLNKPGLYRGFDFNGFATNVLQLNQATGIIVTLFDNPTWTTEARGVILTKQGVVLQDTQSLNFNINTNTSSYPRIDIVVCEHEYVNTPGGSTIQYYIEQGTPSATPVIPTPTTPTQCKIVLGWIYIPAGCTNMQTGGAKYFRKPIKDYLAQIENGKALQALYGSASGGFLDFQNGVSNHFVVDDPGGLTDYVAIQNLNNLSFSSDGMVLKCTTKIPLKFVSGGNIQFISSEASVHIQIGEVFEVWDFNGLFGTTNTTPTYFVYRGNEAKKDDYNKFRSGVSFTKGTCSMTGTHVNLGKTGNVFTLSIPNGNSIEGVEGFNPTDYYSGGTPPPVYGGTLVILNVIPSGGTGLTWTLKDHTFSSDPYKQIFNPGGDVAIQGQATIFLIEFEQWYQVVSIISTTYNLPFIWATLMALNSTVTALSASVQPLLAHEAFVSLGAGALGTMANGQPIPTLNAGMGSYVGIPTVNINHGAPDSLYPSEVGNPLRLRMRSDGKTVQMQGCIQITACAIIAGQVFTLPLGYRPYLPVDFRVKAVFYNNSGVAGYETSLHIWTRSDGFLGVNFTNEYNPDTTSYLTSYPNVMLYFNNQFSID